MYISSTLNGVYICYFAQKKFCDDILGVIKLGYIKPFFANQQILLKVQAVFSLLRKNLI